MIMIMDDYHDDVVPKDNHHQYGHNNRKREREK